MNRAVPEDVWATRILYTSMCEPGQRSQSHWALGWVGVSESLQCYSSRPPGAGSPALDPEATLRNQQGGKGQKWGV